MNLYEFFKQIAFKLDPEKAHHLSLSLASKAPRVSKFFSPISNDPKLALSSNSLRWPFPVGLAAGFDKNAQALSFFEQIGFGAIEIGTVTKMPQVGNSKPRVWRHEDSQSLRNAMGFPNLGHEKILSNLNQAKNINCSLGVNIGKNKNTTKEDTPEEYGYLYDQFAPVSDYIVINISSPNTPGLREFQKKEMLSEILSNISFRRKKLTKPTFIKIAPDLTETDIAMICELSKEKEFSGVIATNTSNQHPYKVGGISGGAISELSCQVRKLVCENLREDSSQTIIGVGGISNYQQLKQFWRDGGHFAQVYTSFIYQGPQLLRDIQSSIYQDLDNNQFKDLQELHSNILKVP